MEKKIKVSAAGILIVAAALLSSMTAFARSSVGSISLGFSSDITAGESGGTVSVWQRDSNSRYYIGDYEIANEDDDDDWSINDRPEVEVELIANDGYYFDSKSKSNFSLSGDGATYKNAIISSNSQRLVLTVKLDKLGGGEEATGLTWDEESGEASWDELSWADEYEVRLRRGGSTVGSTVKTSDTSYDFSERITRNGYYSFEVRGIDDGNGKGDWAESNEWYVSSSEARDLSGSHGGSYNSGSSGNSNSGSSKGPGANLGQWIQDQTGWWYRNSNGSYAVNNWQYIKSVWYFFDERGYMKTGWILWKDKWYYCDGSGAMLANTTTPDGYRVDRDGAWVP